MKYITLIFAMITIALIYFITLQYVIKQYDAAIDLKILAHTLQTPPVSYEEIVSIINDTVVSGAIITEYIE